MNEFASDTDLVARAVAGEQAALEELLLNHYDRLASRIAHKIPSDLQSVLTAEDVLQETFLEVARRIGEFQPRDADAFGGWLSTIAEHRLIDLARAQRAAKRGGGRAAVNAGPDDWSRSLVDMLTLVAVHERTPSRSVAAREVVSAIRAALPRINADYCEALRLRYIEGLPVDQTAERMGRTSRAVHMLCHRGLQQLRDVLGDDARFLSKKA